YFGFCTLFATVFGYFMQRVDTYIEHIIILIDDAYSLLFCSVDINGLQATITPYSIIYMTYKIAGLQFTKRLDCNGLALAIGLLNFIFMKALKNLMVGINHHFVLMVYKSTTDSQWDRHKIHLCSRIFKYHPQALQLLCIICKYVCSVMLLLPLTKIGTK